MYIYIRYLACIFKRLSINIRKQLSVIGLLVATSCFKPLKYHVISWSKVIILHSNFVYQSSRATFNWSTNKAIIIIIIIITRSRYKLSMYSIIIIISNF